MRRDGSSLKQCCKSGCKNCGNFLSDIHESSTKTGLFWSLIATAGVALSLIPEQGRNFWVNLAVLAVNNSAGLFALAPVSLGVIAGVTAQNVTAAVQTVGPQKCRTQLERKGDPRTIWSDQPLRTPSQKFGAFITSPLAINYLTLTAVGGSLALVEGLNEDAKIEITNFVKSLASNNNVVYAVAISLAGDAVYLLSATGVALIRTCGPRSMRTEYTGGCFVPKNRYNLLSAPADDLLGAAKMDSGSGHKTDISDGEAFIQNQNVDYDDSFDARPN